ALQCTLDNEHLRVLGTRYQLNENTNTTKLMIPIVTISAVLVLSYPVTYAIFFPSLGQNASITKELLNSISQYAPVAEFLVSIHYVLPHRKTSYLPALQPFMQIFQILLMPVTTIAFMFSMLALSTPIRRSFFRLTGLRRCFHDSTNRIDSAQHAATAIHFEMLEKQWNEIYKREHCRLPRRSQHYV
ncbi:hypothetical protein Tcan_00375, partial [Toxocara canis]